MDLSGWIGRLAAQAATPVFAVAGGGAREAVQDLRLRPELRLVDTPRAANILLVAGAIADAWRTPLARLHDTMPHPRATLVWRASASTDPTLPGLHDPVDAGPDPVATAGAIYRDLVTGRRATEPPILPDTDPAPWRGVGPYGQGGTGMTGGVPYGRPMAELAPDPDGLRLDVLPVAVGPFFPRLPAGLVLDVWLAGDLVLEGTVVGDTLGDHPVAVRPGLQPFVRALEEPVPIADLETARAREHLRWLADALHAAGLEALAVHALRLATAAGPGDAARVAGLADLVRRTQVGRWSLPSAGRLDADAVRGLGLGPVTRAAGVSEDVRLDDPAYRELGFAPVRAEGGHAWSRWEVRLAEAAQSLDLAARAGDRRTQLVGRVESPRGRLERGDAPTERTLALVPALLREMEWGDAIATLSSLDLDLDEAVLARPGHAIRAVA